MTAVTVDWKAQENLANDLADSFGLPRELISAPIREDILLLYGLLGGKDAGKSSLINSLVGDQISKDPDEMGVGTSQAVLYLHEADQAAWAKRLEQMPDESRQKLGQVHMIRHKRDLLRGVGLMDLPDIDSRYLEHRVVTSAAREVLDGFVWVSTWARYKDETQWEWLQETGGAADRYLFVLNKVDVLVESGKSTLEELGERFGTYVKRRIALDGAPEIYLISATKKTYQFDRLFARLIRYHSPEEIRSAQAANAAERFKRQLEHLDEQYRIQETARDLRLVENRVREEVMGISRSAGDILVQRAVMADPRPTARLAWQLLNHRLGGWWLGEILLSPIRIAVALASVGSSVVSWFSIAETQAPRVPLERLDASLVEKISHLQWKLQDEVPGCFDWIRKRVDPEFPWPNAEGVIGVVGSELGEQLVQNELALAESIKARYTEIAARRAYMVATVVPPLWFFLIQPAHKAMGSFRSFVNPMSWLESFPDMLADMLQPHQFVAALLATAMTEAFLLAWIHMRCYRVAEDARQNAVKTLAAEDMGSLLARAMLKPLEGAKQLYFPFEERWARLCESTKNLPARLEGPPQPAALPPSPVPAPPQRA